MLWCSFQWSANYLYFFVTPSSLLFHTRNKSVCIWVFPPTPTSSCSPLGWAAFFSTLLRITTISRISFHKCRHSPFFCLFTCKIQQFNGVLPDVQYLIVGRAVWEHSDSVFKHRIYMCCASESCCRSWFVNIAMLFQNWFIFKKKKKCKMPTKAYGRSVICTLLQVFVILNFYVHVNSVCWELLGTHFVLFNLSFYKNYQALFQVRLVSLLKSQSC